MIRTIKAWLAFTGNLPNCPSCSGEITELCFTYCLEA